MRGRILLVVGLCLSPAASFADGVAIVPDRLSVSDMYRGNKGQKNQENLCGMHVLAETKQPDSSVIDWDFAWSVVTDGTIRQGGVSVGSFVVSQHVKGRTPRPPITALTFLVDGAKEPAVATVISAPNADNGIVAALPERFVEDLFELLDEGRLITVDITYGSAERETLKVRTHGGTSGDHGRNAPMKKCLAILAPAHEPGPVIQIPHAGS